MYSSPSGIRPTAVLHGHGVFNIGLAVLRVREVEDVAPDQLPSAYPVIRQNPGLT
jgi:hypothetical protein